MLGMDYGQHGADRAKYGEGLLKKLAARLNDDKFRLSSLKSYRQFFRVYPELAAPVRAYLVSRFGGGCALPRQIGQTLSGLSDSSQILLISGDEVRVNPFALFNRISFSHIIELLKMPVDKNFIREMGAGFCFPQRRSSPSSSRRRTKGCRRVQEKRARM